VVKVYADYQAIRVLWDPLVTHPLVEILELLVQLELLGRLELMAVLDLQEF